VRRLTEGAAELAAEMRLRKVCRPRQAGDVEGLAVARVDQIFRAKQVADGGLGLHRTEYCSAAMSFVWAGRLTDQE
jgi:hypothetical protein